MNVPNRLTILRVAMIPAFILFMLWNSPYSDYLAAAVFIAACVTDFFDGYLARKYNQITTFGKFMDPLADKLLVCSAMICFVADDNCPMPVWIVVVIIAREFIISGFRLVAAEKGVVIAASYWAKVKTAVQMIMSIVLIFNFQHPIFFFIDRILIYSALVLTVVSLIDYIYKNRDVMSDAIGKDAVQEGNGGSKESSEQWIVKELTKRNATIATAESCTGGLLSGSIVNVSGASMVLNQSFVTYSNDAKHRILGVRKETLEREGAVSRETASQMAAGAAKAANADVALSVTGIAGPDGGTAEKPVGLVYIGCYCFGETVVEKHIFKGNRAVVRNASVECALLLARKCLKK